MNLRAFVGMREAEPGVSQFQDWREKLRAVRALTPVSTPEFYYFEAARRARHAADWRA